jgi:hypothetical protein
MTSLCVEDWSGDPLDVHQDCLNFPRRLQKSTSKTACGGELRGGVNPLRDRLKLDNRVMRAMWVVMKLVRVASKHHLRNWEAPDALVQEITPSGELNG